MPRYVALLRGINVGGKNLIPMPALKASFEDAGFDDVRTYIQSGNVLFTAPSATAADLTRRVERLIRKAFDHYDASVVLRSRSQMRAVVQKAPKGFGTDPATYRYDVVFLKPPLTANAAAKEVPTKEGVDRIWPANGVIYASRLVSRVTSSRLNRIVGTPVYKNMTLRNWNTTKKLHELLEEE